MVAAGARRGIPLGRPFFKGGSYPSLGKRGKGRFVVKWAESCSELQGRALDCPRYHGRLDIESLSTVDSPSAIHGTVTMFAYRCNERDASDT